jgi:predicted lipid-binding transport protein (Tim44 family)
MGTTLTGTVAEYGNDLVTVRDFDLEPRMNALAIDDPDATWDKLAARFTMIYGRLNAAWNAHDLKPVRGLCTGALLDYLRYWLEEYARQQLSNTIADAQLTQLVPAKLRRDHYYDALTVRMYATGHDFTTDMAGHVVGGSKDWARPYTEYWTFLRAATRRGPALAAPNCPNCGAPLQISDAGACDHCGAQVETGDFDWVLSKIEQDDVYAG